MNSRDNLQIQLDKFHRELRRLVAQLRDVGFIWHGSIHRSLLTCGKSNCRCHDTPSARHGPYAKWTTKVAGKTVSRLLTPVEADLYEGWIENRRRVESVVSDIKALSVKAARVILKLRSLADAPKPRARA